MRSDEIIRVTDAFGARNYLPLPVVLERGEGVWVWDVEGNKYMDMLSSYSALNQGHRHKDIIDATKKQLDRLTLTSRAFYNDKLGEFQKKVCELTKMEKMLPMNTGAEAVETAIKAVRKWGYLRKFKMQNAKCKMNNAEIIVCENNFHGRTTTIVGFSSESQYKFGFGPFAPGFKMIPYNNSSALKNAITDNTVGFLVEPIQGEGGIIIPEPGYLRECKKICEQNNVLFIADEIQTGLGRTGRMFACEWEDVKPDMYILGKALGGGIYPVSCIACNSEIMDVFTPGDHGSTFGGNPLAAVVGIASLDVIINLNLPKRAEEMGNYFLEDLKKIKSDYIKEVRGRGLLIGIEVKKEKGTARPICERLAKEGVLAKETHEQVVRFAPPLTIEKEEIDWALERIKKVFGL
ncbi:MAG: ornithine--oxo-acid transaminase [bacterium (Candidatus Stahlbacteria) CG08_land_8_20_14_0_20_40_26]|nr:MAG: ornithine--oxo-acid transaminase [bacterium (Candidatus Stahlbacteria) CG23_combo_of_CG06-09_8_20_14_all_40_9]PIS23939.1 MAG: ornithine--oxo-acid transaminase [bacterium (Candidatus Stahlbacteria) CG08_land_8_20_14_0_20_40_26]